MKILYLTNHLKSNDGWSRYSLDFAREVQRQGNKVLCITSEKSDQCDVEENVLLKKPLKYLANPFLTIVSARKVNKLIKHFSPDIVHFIVEPYASMLPFICLQNKKSVITVHGTWSFAPSLLKNYFKKIISFFITLTAYRKADAIVAVSNYTKKYLMQKYKSKKNKKIFNAKIKVITNGINSDFLDKAKQRHAKNNSLKQILFVGAVTRRKGISEAVDALKYYNDHISNNFVYNIVGNYHVNNQYYKKVSDKIKKYHLEDNIIFRGWVSDEALNNYYQAADIFLMLPISGTHFEGFGLVYLEAGAYGVPCIGSMHCGAEDAIVNDRTGFLADPGDVKSIAEKIDMVLNQNSISPDACREWAQKNSIALKTKKLLLYYNEMVVKSL